MFECVEDKLAQMVLKHANGLAKTMPIEEGSFSYSIPRHKWISLKELDLKPPEGFYFDKLREEDHQLVQNMWRFGGKSEGDFQHQKCKIERLPTACLRVEGSAELACFEGVETNGMMTNLFTFEKFRKRGESSQYFSI